MLKVTSWSIVSNSAEMAMYMFNFKCYSRSLAKILPCRYGVKLLSGISLHQTETFYTPSLFFFRNWIRNRIIYVYLLHKFQQLTIIQKTIRSFILSWAFFCGFDCGPLVCHRWRFRCCRGGDCFRGHNKCIGLYISIRRHLLIWLCWQNEYLVAIEMLETKNKS